MELTFIGVRKNKFKGLSPPASQDERMLSEARDEEFEPYRIQTGSKEILRD
jgi:hypothetical protein